MSKIAKNPLRLDPFGLFKTGRTAAKKSQKEQKEAIAKQRQVTELELAEQEGVVARKRSLAKSGSGGRQSLIKTSESGVKSNNLGGTV
jgi:hypothetical protein